LTRRHSDKSDRPLRQAQRP